MERYEKVDKADVRAMLRLANQLHAMHDSLARKRQMVADLCDLTDAQCGAIAVTHDERDERPPRIVSIVEHEPCPSGDLRSALIAAGLPLAVANIEQSLLESAERKSLSAKGRRPNRPAKHLISRRFLCGPRTAAMLCLCRTRTAAAPFTRRHRLLVDLFHEEADWVYQPDLLLVTGLARSLSPRERQTLERLLAGDSEKQIASKLKLSPNTVHHYVKSIHRHFDVSSRAELLHLRIQESLLRD